MSNRHKPIFGREAVDKDMEDQLKTEMKDFHIEHQENNSRQGPKESVARGDNKAQGVSLGQIVSESLENNQGSKFAAAVTMLKHHLATLQKEHDKELDFLRQDMEGKVNSLQKELQDARGSNLAQFSPKGMNESGTVDNPEVQKNDALHVELPELLELPEFQQSHVFSASPVSHDATPMSQDTQEAAEKSRRNEMNRIKLFLSKGARGSFSFIFKNQQDESKLPQCRQKLMKMVTSTPFDMMCAAAIITNALLMGIQIDYTARRNISPLDLPIVFRYVDRAYTVFFVCELVTRLCAFHQTFFYRHGWQWNLFDVLVVTTDAIQTVVEIAYSENDGVLGSFTALRILRVLRVTRAVRVVRLVRFFRELRMMVYSVMKCGTSLMWSALMFAAIIYMFSIFLMNVVAIHVAEKGETDLYHKHYRHHWNTLPQSMWTLFSCMTGGIGWMEVADPLVHIGWINGATMGFFMFFTIFVVTNIITGIFVDTAIQSAQSDRDVVIQEQIRERDDARLQLKDVFQEADTDHSGYLTKHEFCTHLQDEKVRAHLSSLGLEVDAAVSLFRILDENGSDHVEIEKFLFECMRLKGGARSLDISMLTHENKRMTENINRFHHEFSEILSAILLTLEELSSSPCEKSLDLGSRLGFKTQL